MKRSGKPDKDIREKLLRGNLDLRAGIARSYASEVIQETIFPRSDDTFKELVAEYLRLYDESENGVHLWHAYRICRDRELPLPPKVVDYLDVCAQSAVSQSDPTMIAAGMQLVSAAGGRSGRDLADLQQRRLLACKAYAMMRDLIDAKADRAPASYRAARELLAPIYEVTADTIDQWFKADNRKQ
jgi:hypothetical protein